VSALRTEDESAFVANTCDMRRAFRDMTFSSGAQRMLDEPNAGGHSEVSEAVSFEMLRRAFDAHLIKTEMSIEYEWDGSKKTDFSVLIAGDRVGVSVTRAFHWRSDSLFTVAHATSLLTKKLKGVQLSSRDVAAHDGWTRQMLHVWVTTEDHVATIHDAVRAMDAALIGNTIVFVTVAAGNHSRSIFTNAM
jgi:hypothetical protein